eukprot:SAG11_NODE_1749_length_4320_cov_15.669983_5_plen_80_part_00
MRPTDAVLWHQYESGLTCAGPKCVSAADYDLHIPMARCLLIMGSVVNTKQAKFSSLDSVLNLVSYTNVLKHRHKVQGAH